MTGVDPLAPPVSTSASRRPSLLHGFEEIEADAAAMHVASSDAGNDDDGRVVSGDGAAVVGVSGANVDASVATDTVETADAATLPPKYVGSPAFNPDQSHEDLIDGVVHDVDALIGSKKF